MSCIAPTRSPKPGEKAEEGVENVAGQALRKSFESKY